MTDPTAGEAMVKLMGVLAIIGGWLFLGWGLIALLSPKRDRIDAAGEREAGCVYAFGGLVFLIIGAWLVLGVRVS